MDKHHIFRTRDKDQSVSIQLKNPNRSDNKMRKCKLECMNPTYVIKICIFISIGCFFVYMWLYGSPSQFIDDWRPPVRKMYATIMQSGNAEDTLISTFDLEETTLKSVKEVTNCLDKDIIPHTQLRGDYWILYNYVPASRRFRCHESITYTTHSDFSFMDNLQPLIERWRGPLSIALYAPGNDFYDTLSTIAYLRDCTIPLVKEFVTFHVYFNTKHIPEEVPNHDQLSREPYNCSLGAPYENLNSSETYKTKNELTYPVNVGRNVAREMAQTHFILPSDVELYPSPNIIPGFLRLIARNEGPLLTKNPKAFVLHLFEVKADQNVPENKTTLLKMLKEGTAIPFHKQVCSLCHSIPKSNEWINATVTEGLHVFHVGKRVGNYAHWEPIFIGTHLDPLYDERLSWEGRSDKMTQGYALCVLDYEFLVLDNAFLVHKPGIKTYSPNAQRHLITARTNDLLNKVIYPELKVMFGLREGCEV